MGFGDEDRFVVITDGEPVMNMTFFWRDADKDATDVAEKRCASCGKVARAQRRKTGWGRATCCCSS